MILMVTTKLKSEWEVRDRAYLRRCSPDHPWFLPVWSLWLLSSYPWWRKWKTMVCDEEKLLFCHRMTRRRTILLSQPSVIPNRLSLDSNVPVMRKKMSRTKKIEACGWQEAKQSIREEKEKIWNYFSHFERRKRNLNSLSPVLRREREIWKLFLLFREEEEKVEFNFPSFEKRKRNQLKYS